MSLQYGPNVKWLLKDLLLMIHERNNEALKTMQDERKRLRFESKYGKLNDSLDNVKKYCPVSMDKLKTENEILYLRLKREDILSVTTTPTMHIGSDRYYNI